MNKATEIKSTPLYLAQYAHFEYTIKRADFNGKFLKSKVF